MPPGPRRPTTTFVCRSSNILTLPRGAMPARLQHRLLCGAHLQGLHLGAGTQPLTRRPGPDAPNVGVHAVSIPQNGLLQPPEGPPQLFVFRFCQGTCTPLGRW